MQCLPDSRSLGCGSRDPDLRRTCCDENVLLDLHCGGGTFTVESGSHHWCANIAARFVETAAILRESLLRRRSFDVVVSRIMTWPRDVSLVGFPLHTSTHRSLVLVLVIAILAIG